MKCFATIKLKLPCRKELLDLFSSYLQATQFACDVAHTESVKHKFDLHHLVYKDLRQQFGLKSQFAINSIAKAFEAYKSSKKLNGRKPVFKHVPVRYDRRTFTFQADSISLSTNGKRCVLPLEIPEYYWKYLDWQYQTADLCMVKDKLFINVTFSREVQPRSSFSEALGVDLGVNNLAVCSDGQVFTGHKTRIIQHMYLRKRLQAKGTKSAKKKLRLLSGRQKRYMTWVNHNVSKQIVASADTIVLEDLTGIRKGNRKGKRFNRWLHNWSFFQLRQFIEYKAAVLGKKVVAVNPYMTSQTCSACGAIGSRVGDSFCCLHCGFSSHADFNASCNLRRLSITQPIVSVDEAKGQILTTEADIRGKYPAL